jgi:2-oxoglutarate dehydrogenase E1 component
MYSFCLSAFLQLEIESYGFTQKDLDRPIDLSGLGTNVKGALAKLSGTSTTLRELIEHLEKIYCSSVGVEYMHIRSRDECNWIRERIEVEPTPLSKDQKLKILERLNYSETFEYFLSQKFNTAKRFGVEGNEALIPGMKAMVDRSTELGVENIVVGMAHRGRLNVLTNVIRNPLELIFKEFAGTHFMLDKMQKVDVDGDGIADWSGSGDVKYHLGTNFTRKYPDGREIHLSLLANPSHLEAVNPLVVGKARAKMTFMGDSSGTGNKVMPVMIHGDAAIAGQGIVYETFTMSQLRNYRTGGSIHIVINNQIGFTTDPHDSRSTKYCSDIGKTFECPIFHVNADDAEATVRVFQLAAEFRNKFHR